MIMQHVSLAFFFLSYHLVREDSLALLFTAPTMKDARALGKEICKVEIQEQAFDFVTKCSVQSCSAALPVQGGSASCDGPPSDPVSPSSL